MLFFRSEDHVQRWCAQWHMTQGAVLSLPAGWALAQAWYGVPRNTPGWRRFSLEEAERVFEGIGLVGPFWSLRG